MLSLAQFDLIPLIVALAIGAAAGRWAFAKPKASAVPVMKDEAQP
ncbi:MAG TPA: hypothetical protein VIT38_06215 [Allosphingosinicella sp.]|jgi:hypothetical protein